MVPPLFVLFMKYLQSFKTAAFAIIVLLASVKTAHADDYFNHNGIRFKIESFANQELRVTYPEETNYSDSVVIPSTIRTKQGQVWTVTSIGENAFRWNYKTLRSVTIPKTVKYIHPKAFGDGCKVEEITADCPARLPIKENVEAGGIIDVVNLGINATVETCAELGGTWKRRSNKNHCWRVGVVTLKPANSNLSLVDGALYNKAKTVLLWLSSRKETYVMPSTVKRVAERALSGKYKLTNITLSSSLEKIDDEMFWANDIKTIVIPNSVTEIGRKAFYQCDRLESITIPKSVTKIYGGELFFYCKSLKSITIPNCMTRIEEFDFWGCENLEKLIIHENVRYIDEHAFTRCYELKYIYCYAKTPPCRFGFYHGVLGNATPVKEIHVPRGCKAAYENSDWMREGITIIDDL